MGTNVNTLAELQNLIKVEEENYRRAIEDMHDFEEAKKIYLKIKEIKKAIDMVEENKRTVTAVTETN
jgi:predicted patatin/cPLA2 family phospholipase